MDQNALPLYPTTGGPCKLERTIVAGAHVMLLTFWLDVDLADCVGREELHNGRNVLKPGQSNRVRARETGATWLKRHPF